MRYAALLRGVNVGGKMVSMAALRDLAAKLGLDDPRTLLQSGNLVFGSRAGAAKLESLLEAETKKRLGVETRYLLRTAEEWKALVAANPYPAAAKTDPAHLAVLFLRDAPTAKQVELLQAAIVGRETVRAAGKQAYIVYPDGMGESKLSLPKIEKALATTGTARNWNTVLKIGALLES
jgi:uncharacterized protein (DUF1697 family)